MLQIRQSRVKVKNPSTGEYEGVAGLGGAPGEKGDSMYDLAVRNGFTGTEEEFLKEFTPDEVLSAVEKVSGSVHTHENKNVLDIITEDSVHTHENLLVLAGITLATVAKWNGAVDDLSEIRKKLPQKFLTLEDVENMLSDYGSSWRARYPEFLCGGIADISDKNHVVETDSFGYRKVTDTVNNGSLIIETLYDPNNVKIAQKETTISGSDITERLVDDEPELGGV